MNFQGFIIKMLETFITERFLKYYLNNLYSSKKQYLYTENIKC